MKRTGEARKKADEDLAVAEIESTIFGDDDF
jgi:hypothetical protein